jgi:integrase
MGFLIKDALKRSPYWIAAFRASDGRQLRKSTKCRDKRQAQIVLQGLEAAELLGVGSTAAEHQIRALMHETIFRVTGRKTYDPTVSSYIATWLKGQKDTVGQEFLAHTHQILHSFESFLGARRHARLEALSKDVFLEYREALQRDGISANYINKIIQTLRGLFQTAHGEGLITRNPLDAIKSLRREPAEKGTFTAAQISQLLEAAPDAEWRGLIALGYYTGGRVGDLSRLTWEKIDLEQHTINFRQQKTGTAVLVPIHPELARYLSELPHGIGRAPVLPALSVIKKTCRLSEGFTRIMLKAGIDQGVARKKAGQAGRNVSKLSFHSLRHSFTSELARAGVPPEVRQRMTGHASAEIHQHYTHLEIDVLAKAVALLPSLPPVQAS